MIWYHDNTHELPILHVEQDEPLGVRSGEEGGVGVDTDRLVPAEPVLVKVQVDLVQRLPTVRVNVDVTSAWRLGGALQYTVQYTCRI